jgi:hypothetical protein
MTTIIGYAHCSTGKQDLAVQKMALKKTRRPPLPNLGPRQIAGFSG